MRQPDLPAHLIVRLDICIGRCLIMSRKEGNRGSRKPRGKKHFRGQQDARLKRDELEASTREADNDVRWYGQNPQLIKDFASLPFNYMLGAPIPSDNLGIAANSISGIMVLKFIPTVGVATSETSPINVAMRSLFAQVRRANSGSTNYDPADLMLYVLAMDSALSYLAHIKRGLGMLYAETPYNRYYVKYLMEASGYDYANFAANAANIRGYINLYAAKLSSMAIPAYFSYLARHQWMCSNYYWDSPTVRAQTYIFRPAGFLKFALDSSGAGSLTLSPVGILRAENIVTYGDQLLNPIITNQDFNIMSGDILKAFGDAGVVKPAGIADGAVLLPQYSAEVLTEIENATVHGIDNPKYSICQNTAVGGGYLYEVQNFNKMIIVNTAGRFAVPKTTITQYMIDGLNAKSQFLNFHKDGPSPEDIMIATRMKSFGQITGLPTADGLTDSIDPSGTISELYVPVTVTGHASEIFTMMTMYRLSYGSGSVNPSVTQMTTSTYELVGSYTYTGQTGAPSASAGAMERSNLLSVALSQFDWHPFVKLEHFSSIGSSSTSPTVTDNTRYASNYLGDFDNYTIIDEVNQNNISGVAMLSMLT